MGFVQIVPVHLINSNREHSFIGFVDSLGDEAAVNEFIHKEGSCMSIVEDQWVPQRFRLCEEGLVTFDHCKQFFVNLIGLSKIVKKLLFQIWDLNSAFEGL